MSQIVERFAAAVDTLVGDGPVKNRLMHAYCEYLEDLRQVDLPIAGKGDLSELHLALHNAMAVGKVDCVTASVQKMSPHEARQHAQTIVRLYTEVLAMEKEGRIQVERTLQAPESAPPRFLAGRGR